MPSDTTPPSGYRLEDPARTAGGASARRPAQPDPSWFTVIVTTLRLWLRRRILRVPDSTGVSKLRGAVLAAVTLLIAIAIAAVAVGGTLLSGGRATVTGTLIGALIIQLVRYTLLANGVPDDAAKLVKAALIVAAVWLQGRGRA